MEYDMPYLNFYTIAKATQDLRQFIVYEILKKGENVWLRERACKNLSRTYRYKKTD